MRERKEKKKKISTKIKFKSESNKIIFERKRRKNIN